MSATKFLNGHSDIMGGILSVKGQDLAKRIYFTQVLTKKPVFCLATTGELFSCVQIAEASILSPIDCWLCLCAYMVWRS